MPKVSVIVPVYHALGTLPRSVQSVLCQTLPDLELLLVDDGSKDGTGALCDRLAAGDARVRVLHKENGGVSSARNAGLAAARGQWVLFLDADDAMAPCTAEAALAAAEAHPEHLPLWPFAGALDELPSAPAGQGQPLPMSQLARMQLQNLLPMPWNKCYRLDIIREAGLHFDEGYTLGEDLLFCLDYCAAFAARGGAGFCLLEQPLTYYEQGGADSLTHRLRPDFLPLWKSLYTRLFADCDTVFACPRADCTALRRAALETIAAGAADLLERGEGTPAQRRSAVRRLLRDPWLQGCRRAVAAGGLFSLYAPGIALGCPYLTRWAVGLRQNDDHRFYQLQYTGEAIRQRLHPGRRSG